MSTNLMFLALLPGILIIFFVYRKDKVESEPKSLIVKLIIFGAISCVPAVILEMLMEGILPQLSGISYAVTNAFLVAALCEEVCKYILLRLGSWRNRAFDYRFDGIVYGVAVAVGFALLENILYVAEGGLSTALMRGVLAVPLHAFCGVFMGAYYGTMKMHSIRGERAKASACQLKALVVPIMIHGIYDSLAFMENGTATILLLVFVGFMYVKGIRKVNLFAGEDWRYGFYDHLRPVSDNDQDYDYVYRDNDNIRY